MSFSHIVWQEKDQLQPMAHHAVVHGMLDTWKRCTLLGMTPEEPDFVAGLVLVTAPVLYDALRAVFRQHRIRVSLASVFCHQTPHVTFPGMTNGSCELGDLLIVHVHATPAGAVTRNALLYQAKRTSQQPYAIPSSEEDQLRLYTEWPTFEYVRSGPLTGQQRRVCPGLPHLGAQYLLIDDRPPSDSRSGLAGAPNTYPVGSCMADQYLHDHADLASELLAFLLLRSGRPFLDRSHLEMDGWSEIVWDLLATSLRKALTRKRSGRASAPRYAGAPLHVLDSCSFAQATNQEAQQTVTHLLGPSGSRLLYSAPGDPPPSDDWPGDELPGPGGGVAVILVETAETRNEEEPARGWRDPRRARG